MCTQTSEIQILNNGDLTIIKVFIIMKTNLQTALFMMNFQSRILRYIFNIYTKLM